MDERGAGRPRVDVGIVTWNTAEVTVEALQHLLGADQGCDVRILVWDNGSIDGTADAIRERCPGVEVTAGAANLGFAGGVNRLLEQSDAPWFFALNSDAWPEAGAIGTLVGAAQAQPRAALVAPRLERPDGALEHSTHPFPSVGMAWLHASGRVARLPATRAAELLLEPAWEHDRARTVDWAVGAAWLMRREAIDDVGHLDESFFMYAEDLEWCWRARRRGWEILFEPSAVVRHIGDASGRQVRDEQARMSVYLRNTNVLVRRVRGRGPAVAYRGLQAVACARQALRYRRRGDRAMARFWAAQARTHLSPSRSVRP